MGENWGYGGVVAKLCLTLATPWTIYSLPGSSVLYPQDFPGKNTGVGCHFFLQVDLPGLGIEPGSLALKADSLLTGKPQWGL